jgi:hypothetical protein
MEVAKQIDYLSGCLVLGKLYTVFYNTTIGSHV